MPRHYHVDMGGGDLDGYYAPGVWPIDEAAVDIVEEILADIELGCSYHAYFDRLWPLRHTSPARDFLRIALDVRRNGRESRFQHEEVRDPWVEGDYDNF